MILLKVHTSLNWITGFFLEFPHLLSMRPCPFSVSEFSLQSSNFYNESDSQSGSRVLSSTQISQKSPDGCIFKFFVVFKIQVSTVMLLYSYVRLTLHTQLYHKFLNERLLNLSLNIPYYEIQEY